MTMSEGFYIESASTGRFRRCEASENDARGWRLPMPSKSSNHREHDVQVMFRFAFVGFLFIQGILSGLSLSALYEVFTARSPGEFFAQHSAQANEVRRYFFIMINICATGSLCMLDEDAVAQVWGIVKGRNTPSRMAKSNMTEYVLVLNYSVALIFTILCSREDVHISNIAMHVDNGDLYNEDLLSITDRWQGFAIPRSLLCILGWLVSCYRFVAMRNSVQRDE